MTDTFTQAEKVERSLERARAAIACARWDAAQLPGAHPIYCEAGELEQAADRLASLVRSYRGDAPERSNETVFPPVLMAGEHARG